MTCYYFLTIKFKFIDVGGMTVSNKCVCYEHYTDDCPEVGTVSEGREAKSSCVGKG